MEAVRDWLPFLEETGWWDWRESASARDFAAAVRRSVSRLEAGAWRTGFLRVETRRELERPMAEIEENRRACVLVLEEEAVGEGRLSELVGSAEIF